MTTTPEIPDANAAPAQVLVNPKPHISRWRTASERSEGLRTKKLRRRAAHRVALRRSHSKG
jgi:hypothetical protein